MSDLHYGQTMTELFKFISDGAAHTFNFNFPPDKVVFYNLTKWTNTAGGEPISIWWREQNAAAQAYQQQVIDSSAGASFNFLDTTTNGFTVANTAGGQAGAHADISGVTAADPVEITHSAYTFQTDQIVRITDLGEVGPNATARGMDELNNKRFKIVVTSSTTFTLKDPVTGEPVDGSNFVAYVSGGQVTVESHVISLNNPQVSPYSNSNPYLPNPFQYDPVEYRLTAGSSVMGDDSDEFIIESYKFGQWTDLDDIA